MCATSFIVSIVQHLKIGDLTQHRSGVSYTSDSESDEMEVDDYDQDVDMDIPRISKEEERSLVRDSTAGFAGIVVVFLVILRLTLTS